MPKPSRSDRLHELITKLDRPMIRVMYALRDAGEATSEQVKGRLLEQQLPQVRARLTRLALLRLVDCWNVPDGPVLGRKYRLTDEARNWLYASEALAEASAAREVERV